MPKQKALKESVKTCVTQRGSLFRHKDGTVYIVGRTDQDQLRLISLCDGNIWDFASLFAGHQSDFSYIGFAEDLIRVQ
jgi:hypothetical protein